ncbi:MAG: leucine-rich repeat protein [Kiritimatiellae bacterium]|nr:leucine-rich repeat protein [Kiritimatiellia bacterium]
MMNMKRVMMIAALLSVVAPNMFAATFYTNEVDGVKWIYAVSDGKATLGGGNSSTPAIAGNPSGKVKIPSVLGETPVVAIASYAFSGKTGIEEFVVPNSVQSIGYSAFGGCPNIRSMTLPFVGACRGNANGQGDNFGYVFGSSSGSTGCTSVRQNYYYNNGNNSSYSTYYIPTSLTSVTITDETLLRPYAFQNCSMLTNIAVNGEVASVGDYAFSGCTGLRSFTMPVSATSIGGFAFSGCSSIPELIVPANVRSVGSYAFQDCSKLSSVRILSDYAAVGQYAFSGCPATIFDTTSIPGLKLIDGYVAGTETALSGVIDLSEMRGVADNAFSGNTKITKVVLPDGMMLVPANAFSGCTSLTSITIPDTVKTISSSAFNGCAALTSITIPDGTTSIGDYAFYGCRKLLSANIPEKVTKVGNYAFANCTALRSVNIPTALADIGTGAFANDSALATVNISDLAAWCRITFADFDSNPTRYSHSLTLDGKVLRDIVIPDEIQKLNPKVFTDNFALTSVIVPEGVPNIPVDAFIGCRGITNMVLPESIADIGEAAFQDCTNLTTVAIPIAVTNISKHAFYGNSASMGLVELILPENVISVGEGAFQNCANLAMVAFPESLAAIGPYAFAGCHRLDSLELPANLATIGNYAFQNCTGFTQIEIPGSVSSIGQYGFYNCANLTNVIVHSGLTSIGNSAFAGSGGLTVSLAEDVTTVRNSLFSSCGGITNVVFTEAVTNIDNYAFQNSTLLAGLNLPSSLKRIGQYSFYGCTGLSEVVIPEGVTSIGQYAFANCTKLVRVVLPSTVKAVGQNTFSGCSRLAGIEMAEGTTAIGNYAFRNCTGLKNIDLPSTVRTVGEYAFEGCSNLGTVSFPDGLTTIGNYAFHNCRKLSGIDIPASVTRIGNYAFAGCNTLSELIIPDGVRSVGSYAFHSCTNLMSLSVPASATNIGWHAFAACSNLAQVTLLTTPSHFIPASDLSLTGFDWTLTDGDTIQADTKKFYSEMTQEATGQGVISFEWRTPGYWYHSNYYNEDYFNSYGYFSLSVDYSEYSYGSYYSDSCNSETWVPVSISMSSGGRHTVDWFFDWDRSAVSNGDVDPSKDFGNIRSLSFVPSRGGNGNGVNGTVVGASAFEGCVNLSRVNIADVGAWCGTIFENAWANPLRYAKRLYVGGNEVKNLVIPDTANAVAGWAFADCGSITNIVIPEGLTSIGTHAFQNTAIGEISLPPSVTNVGTFAFAGCDGVKSVSIPAGLRKINDFAFSGQPKVVSAALPSSTALSKFLPDSLDALREITIADGETGVVDEAFAGCSALEALTIPDTVKTIGRSAFKDCAQLTTVQIPSSVNAIDYDAFDGCGRLREISVGSGNVSYFSEDRVLFDERGTGRKLARCPEALSVKDYPIPDGVTCVGEYSFRNCVNIEKVTIPASMTNVGVRAFMNCGFLAAFDVAEENPVYKSIDGVLFSKDGKTLLRFPPAKAGHYDIPDGVEAIATYAFEGCRRLSSLSFGADVKSIEACAFDGCTVLALTVLNDGLKRIGDYAFKSCTSLAALTIPESVTSLGEGAIDGCDQLESLSVPENIAIKPKNLGGIIRGNVSLYRGCIYNVTNDLVVMGGATLRIPSGVVLKMNSWRSIAVLKGGRLVTTGTRAAPVVITSSKDDEFGGDANGDGNASTPQSGDWGGLRIQGEAELAYTRIRYGQSSYGPGVVSLSNYQYYDDYYYYGEDAEWTDFANYYDDEARLTMDGCIVEHSTDDWSVGVCNEGGNVVARNCVFFDLPSCVYGYGRYVNNSYDSYTMAGQTNHFVNCVFHGCNSVVMDDWYNVDSTAAVFDNCVFSEMVEWVGGYGESIPSDLVFRNCCFWNPGDGFYPIQTNNYIGVSGNICGNPRFEKANAGDFHIKTGSACIDAGHEHLAPARDYFGQPRNGAPDIGIHEIQVRPVNDVDLAALAVSCDAQATVGQPITVTWTVGNVGTEDISDEWRDVVELIDSHGGVVVLGEHTMLGGVVAGGNKTATATFAVPVVTPGQARIRVRANYLRDIYEGSLTANNACTGEGFIWIVVDEVMADGLHEGAIRDNQPTVLKVNVDASNESRMLKLSVPKGCQIKYGFGFVPKGMSYSGNLVSDGEAAFIRVPEEVSEVFISLECKDGGAYAISSEADRTAVSAIEPSSIEPTGVTAVNVSGTGFANTNRIWLVSGSSRVPVAAVYHSSESLTMEIVGNNLLAGNHYGLMIGDGDGALLMEDALYVKTTKGEGKLSARLIVPDSVRKGRMMTGYVEYSNIGTADMNSPIFKISGSKDGTLVGLKSVHEKLHEYVKMVGISRSYPYGLLKVGETVRLPFYYAVKGDYELKLSVTDEASSQKRPGAFPTWQSFCAGIADSATALNNGMNEIYDFVALYDYTMRKAYKQQTGVINVVVIENNTDEVLPGARWVVEDTNSCIVAHGVTDERGRFSVNTLETNEVYRVKMQGLQGESDWLEPSCEDARNCVIYSAPYSKLNCWIDGVDNDVAKVCLIDSSGGSVYAAELVNGECELTNLVDDVYSVRVVVDGFHSVTDVCQVVVESGIATPSELRLHASPAGKVRITLVDGAGDNVAGQTCMLRDVDTAAQFSSCSDKDGVVCFALPRGRYRFNVGEGHSVADDIVIDVTENCVSSRDVLVSETPFSAMGAVGLSPLSAEFAFNDAEKYGRVASVLWDFDNDGTYEAGGHCVTNVYTTPGFYDVGVKLVCEDGTEKTFCRRKCVEVWESEIVEPTDNTVVLDSSSGYEVSFVNETNVVLTAIGNVFPVPICANMNIVIPPHLLDPMEVVSVEVLGDKTLSLATRAMPMQSAYKRLRLMSSSQRLAASSEVKGMLNKPINSPKRTFWLKKTESDGDVRTGFDGSLELSFTVDCSDGEIRCVTCDAEFAGKASISIHASGSKRSRQIWVKRRNLTKKRRFASPVPILDDVVLIGMVPFRFAARVRGEFDLEGEIAATCTVRDSIVWRKGYGASNDFSKNIQPVTAGLVGSAEAKIGVEFTGALGVAKDVNGYDYGVSIFDMSIFGGLGVRLDAKVDTDELVPDSYEFRVGPFVDILMNLLHVYAGENFDWSAWKMLDLQTMRDYPEWASLIYFKWDSPKPRFSRKSETSKTEQKWRFTSTTSFDQNTTELVERRWDVGNRKNVASSKVLTQTFTRKENESVKYNIVLHETYRVKDKRLSWLPTFSKRKEYTVTVPKKDKDPGDPPGGGGGGGGGDGDDGIGDSSGSDDEPDDGMQEDPPSESPNEDDDDHQRGSDDDDPESNVDDKKGNVPQSCDPNEMRGPLGVGEQRHVKPGEWMDYTIYFENATNATAAAQDVYVTLPKDAGLDWSTFELGEVVFGDNIDTGLSGYYEGESTYALPGTNWSVRTEVTHSGDNVVWHLRIVDPTTVDNYPADAYAGFLPPNDETGRGEGHLRYRVRVRDDAAANSVIHATAIIEFDPLNGNKPIETDPAWWNTVGSPGAAFAESDVEASEGETATIKVMGGSADAAASVKVYLTYNTAAAADVDVAKGTVDGTTPKGGLKFPLTLTWAKGEMGEKVITIPVKTDKTVEDDEFFTLQLAEAVGMELGEERVCTVTIRDMNDKTLKTTVTPYKPKKNEMVATNSVTVASGNAKGGFVSGTGEYTSGSKLTLTAEARPGWAFQGWRLKDGDETILSDKAKWQVVVTNDEEYVAVFEKIPYVRGLADPADGGKVSGSALCPAGKKVTLKATASKGFVFTGWVDSRIAIDGERLQKGAVEYIATTPSLVVDRSTKPAKDTATSTTITNVTDDATYYACFITSDEDKASIVAAADGWMLEPWVSKTETHAFTTNIWAGVYLEWPVAASALSETKVKVAGLPAGLKFTDKPVTSKIGSGKTAVMVTNVPANTIYGAPTAASKIDTKTGAAKPSVVKFTVTTAGKSTQTYQIDTVVDALPTWAQGTFAGGMTDGGQVSLTVSVAGKTSGKALGDGLTYTLAAPYYTGFEMTDGVSNFLADVTATWSYKEGTKTIKTNEVVKLVLQDNGIGGYAVAEDWFEAYTVNWKVEPWKTLGKSFDKKTFAYAIREDGMFIDDDDAATVALGADVPARVTLKFAATGAVTIAGEFVTGYDVMKSKYTTVKATGSATLVPVDDERGAVFIYLTPKGLTPHARCMEVRLPQD